jgi:phage/conjugal plasmid C-4 type zinc finger TraR family protein
MDEKYLEQAQALEQHQRSEAMYQHSKRLQGTGQADCEDCSEPIPGPRREAAPWVIRCIDCQTSFERLMK